MLLSFSAKQQRRKLCRQSKAELKLFLNGKRSALAPCALALRMPHARHVSRARSVRLCRVRVNAPLSAPLLVVAPPQNAELLCIARRVAIVRAADYAPTIDTKLCVLVQSRAAVGHLGAPLRHAPRTAGGLRLPSLRSSIDRQSTNKPRAPARVLFVQ